MMSEHENFQVKNCGTFTNKEYPFLHVTPNFLCSCDCCGLGCGEVKCPFCIDSLDFESYALKKSSCLEKIESDFILKKDHDYYHQVQQQLHTTKHNYCDFVVCAFSNNSAKFICERILPNNSSWETQVPKLSLFWHTCILPKILGRWYTRNLDLTIESSLDPNCECYCRKKTMNLLLLVPIQDALFPNFTCLLWPFRRYLKLGTVHTAENFQNLNGKKIKKCIR